MVTTIQKRQEILQEIAKVSCEKNITLVAVSKTFTTQAIIELNQHGQIDFGENYVQEAIHKIQDVKKFELEFKPIVQPKPIIWHFIGHIQANKTQDIAENFDWVHTIEREKIALRLHTQRPKNLPPLNVCIQVNIDDAQSKSGIAAAHNNMQAILSLAKYILELPQLKLRGLMAIPDMLTNPNEANKITNINAFQNMQHVFLALKTQLPQAQIDTLCMGMSQDFKEAIQYGANMVRIGTAIFGAR
jgi:PLP dependent protein